MIWLFFLFANFLVPFSSHSHLPGCGTPNIIKKFKPSRILQASSNKEAAISLERQRIAKGEEPLFSNIRITFDSQFLVTSSLTTKNKNFILNNLLPSVKAFFTSVINVYPRKTPIYPQNNICFSSNLKLSLERQQTGYSNTDLVIFLLGEYNMNENYIAWATFCEFDDANLNRPYVGLLNMNFYYLACDLIGWHSCFNTLVHEVFHILMFHSYLYSYFVNEDGNILGESKVIRLKPGTYNTHQLILPKLVEFAKKYYKCDTIEGLDLENDEASPGSHWEDSIFRDENMSPIDRPNKQISNFTLIFLESTGWYLVDYSKAMPYLFGNERGCGFSQSACNNTFLTPEYCSLRSSVGCQDDYTGIGVCYNNQFSGSCKTYDSSYASLCSEKPIQNGCEFCTLVSTQGGVVSGDSSCFSSNLTDGKLGYYYRASCYKAECVMNGGQKNIKIQIGATEQICTKDNQVITVSGYSGNLICPNISEFCKYRDIKCINNCMEQTGLCLVDKNCIYFEGSGICSANCLSCRNSTYCLNCNTGYYINYNEGIEDQNFCQACKGICPKCPERNYYDAINRICKKCHQSCLKCKGSLATDCLSCSNQLNLLLNNECLDCSQFGSSCLECGKNEISQLACTKCITGYYPSQGKCVRCVDNCIECISSSCITCAEGYISQLGSCSPCESNCLTCEKTNKNCKTCRIGQYLSLTGNCLDFDCLSITNCDKCEGVEILTCLECKSGNYMAPDNTCKKCISDCESCSSANDCNKCNVGFYLFEKTCLACGNNCATCINPAKCTQCMTNYQMDEQKNCNFIECKFNCKFCDGINMNDCIVCIDGFYLDFTGICYKCSNMCLTCKGQGEEQCLSCREGETLVDGRCFNIINTDYSNVKSTRGLLNLTSIYISNAVEESIIVSNIKSIIEKMNGFLGVLSNKEKEELAETMFKISQVDKLSEYDFVLIVQSLKIIQNITSDFQYLSIENKSAITTLNFFTNSLFNMKSLINKNISKNSSLNVAAIEMERNIVETANMILNSNMNFLTIKNNELIITNNFYDAKLILLTNNSGETLKITNTKGQSLFDLNFNLYSKIKSSNGAIQLFLKTLTWKSNPYFISQQNNMNITEKVYDVVFFSDTKTNTPLNIDLGIEKIALSFERNKSQILGPNQTYSCVFWDTAEKIWSKQNISTVVQNEIVQCNTSHFTSFSFCLTNISDIIGGIKGLKALKKIMIEFLLVIGIMIFL